jgi:hypothetical protein
MGDRSDPDDVLGDDAPTSRRRTAEWNRLVAMIDGYAAEEGQTILVIDSAGNVL